MVLEITPFPQHHHTADKRKGWLSHAQTLMSGSPETLKSMPTGLCCLGVVQDLLSFRVIAG